MNFAALMDWWVLEGIILGSRVWDEVDEDGILSKDKVVVFSSPDAFHL